ncbi:hypothetical protein AURDEDRAFT_114428 [Auricularia subglabra TFB-10046 SS5]|nr:hypothetical protein AURDEDRAFT_114428 [Auricularia subglabra TFB-10046 SS5]
MRSSTALLLICSGSALTAFAAPQGTGDINPSTSTTPIAVLVGNGGKTFDPPSVNAKPGDVIMFEFRGGNHTVTQTSFTDPCVPFVNATSSARGFDSGFMAFDASSGMVPAWQLRVLTTEPLWVACMAEGHCQSGMVFAINPTQDKSFEAFKAAAIGDGGNGALARVPLSSWSALAGALLALTPLLA